MRTVRVLPAEATEGSARSGGDADADLEGASATNGDCEDLRPDDRYVLLKASGDAWLVRDPATGERRYLPADRLERVDEPPLAAAAGSVSPTVRGVLTAVRDERTLGLLVTVVDRWFARGADGDAGEDRDPAPTPVRWLLDATALCESDLHGALAELEAAELIARTEADALGGGRAYRPTEAAIDAVERLRDA